MVFYHGANGFRRERLGGLALRRDCHRKSISLNGKKTRQDNTRFKLDKYLLKMCRKERLIEFLHDFVVFDGGVKKLPRVHQYFGVKAAQERVNGYQGGIIWHTQGSGKSIVMVLLAKMDSGEKTRTPAC